MNSTGRTWKDVDATFSTEPEFLKSLKSMSSVQMATTSGIGLIGSKYESHYIQDVLKENGAQALMDMMLKHKVGYESTEYMTWFCGLEHDGSTYHIYDWFHNGSISDLVTQLNAAIEDGFTSQSGTSAQPSSLVFPLLGMIVKLNVLRLSESILNVNVKRQARDTTWQRF